MRRAQASELLDARGFASLDELRDNLHDMGRFARALGVFDLTLRLATQGAPQAQLALDVGCGDGAFMRFAGAALRWVGADLSREVLRCARGALVQADGLHLPFASRSVDVATCVHVLHHLDPPQARALLREIARVARWRWVCVDLQRSYRAWIGAWLVSRLASRNRLTRHDGPLSARRAYTLAEARALVEEADLSLTACGRFRGVVWWMIGAPERRL